MTTFKSSNPETTRILSEELEKKIDEVNAHMVEQRSKAEEFQLKRNQLEQDVKELEEKKKELSKEVSLLEGRINSSAIEIKSLEESIVSKKSELSELRKSNDEMTALNKKESDLLAVQKETLLKKQEDLDAKESAINIYGKSLEEKEKKLDVYATRVKQMLGSLKP